MSAPRISEMRNIAVGPIRTSERVPVSFELGSECFHVFVDVNTLALQSHRPGDRPDKQTLYANPIKQTECRYNTTRYLDAQSKTWAPFVDHALKVVRKDDAVAKQLAIERAEAAAQEQAYIDARRKEVIREAGVELYDALILAREEIHHPGAARSEGKDIDAIIEAALTKAQGKS